MAKSPEHHSEDPEDLDSLPKEPASRRRGIPEAAEERSGAVSDLSRPKSKLPTFQSQDRREAKSMEGVDLEGHPEETPEEQVSPPRQKSAPVPPSRRDEPGIPSPPPPPTASAPAASAASVASTASVASGGEKEAELRREAGRPKQVRSTDFEPLAWESSETKLDLPESEGRMRSGACLGAVCRGLKASWCRLKLVEMASVTIFLLVALLGLFGFRSLVHSGPQPVEEVLIELSSLSMPLEGELLTIANVEAHWREPQPGDLVRPGYLIVPEVRLQLASGTGFLRLLFRDETNKIRGDAVAVPVSNGKIEGASEFTALCSVGYKNPMQLVECRAGRLKPWTIHIYESVEFDVPIGEWRRLAQFPMPCDLAKGGGQ